MEAKLWVTYWYKFDSLEVKIKGMNEQILYLELHNIKR